MLGSDWALIREVSKLELLGNTPILQSITQIYYKIANLKIKRKKNENLVLFKLKKRQILRSLVEGVSL